MRNDYYPTQFRGPESRFHYLCCFGVITLVITKKPNSHDLYINLIKFKAFVSFEVPHIPGVSACIFNLFSRSPKNCNYIPRPNILLLIKFNGTFLHYTLARALYGLFFWKKCRNKNTVKVFLKEFSPAFHGICILYL